MAESVKPRIVVLGGGFGGLETAFLLKMRLRDRADITVVADDDCFTFRPNTIYVPFGLNPARLRVSIKPALARKGIAFTKAFVKGVDAVSRVVAVDERTVPYDFLVVATGARVCPDKVPGSTAHGSNLWTVQEMLELREKFGKLAEDAAQGKRKTVIFTVPPGNMCAGPLYEIILMLDTWLRRKKVRANVHLVLTTFERSYLQVFGPRLHDLLEGEFGKRDIAHHSGWVAERVDTGSVTYRGGSVLPFDLLVSFSSYMGAVAFPGLPADEYGFLKSDLVTRQVAGHPDIYAVGDAGDFPVKQAYLALVQGDSAAEHMASRIMGTKFAGRFEPLGMCVMEEFNKASFMQVPLKLTGVEDRPVEVAAEFPEKYRVGSSVVWRAGKAALGIYTAFRFGRGDPFHAGWGWRAVDLCLKVMSRLFAR